MAGYGGGVTAIVRGEARLPELPRREIADSIVAPHYRSGVAYSVTMEGVDT